MSKNATAEYYKKMLNNSISSIIEFLSNNEIKENKQRNNNFEIACEFFRSISPEFRCSINYYPNEKRIDLEADYMAKSFLEKKIIENRKFRIYQEHSPRDGVYSDDLDYTWLDFRVIWFFEFQC